MRKRITILILTLAIICSTAFYAVNAAGSGETMYGDLDDDGNITAADALLILRNSVNLESFDDTQTALADVDNDGSITAADALDVLRYSVKLDVSSKVGEILNSELDTDIQPSGKTLIVYFTHAENTEADAISGATPLIDGYGTVRVLANMIQDRVGGDLFSIQTEEKYPAEYNAAADFAKEQTDSNARPALSTHVENMDEYDTVFIGYCAWWYDMPMSIYSFLDEYDLTGKNVYVFNTHEGSRFAGGIQSIKEAEPGANVEENGLSIRGNNVSADSKSEVDEWLDGLGF